MFVVDFYVNSSINGGGASSAGDALEFIANDAALPVFDAFDSDEQLHPRPR